MHNIIKISFLLIIIGFSNCGSSEQEQVTEPTVYVRTAPIDCEDEKYEIGQLWKYDARPGEEDSRVLILKIQKTEKGDVLLHVALVNMKIKNAGAENGITTKVDHVAFLKEAIDLSVTELESSGNELPDFEQGYQNWKTDFENAKTGVFDATVKETVQIIENSFL